MSRSPYILASLLLLGATIGCQQAEPPVAAPAASAPTIQPVVATVAATSDQETTRQQVVEAMKNYVAPFPTRNNLFVPPKVTPGTRTSRVTEGAVQLRGIVDLGEPQAILDIEGAVALIPVGREKYGVKVVLIEDQTVTLQRGGTRWTASLD
ncbi:hypothetical protein [Aeoliella mucimassa]|uniref:Pilus formation protein N-terminal domain-containing protein n=1 Tax=Aeoliella mucimassa TaxID=2527972 RepID=A0A518AQX4_9BACT|nr:hypothetical protein [Aeoliella mucimassa]QDU57130.1 hypothetical protein Pan181_33440 [Aeoliella mucimassa]